MTKGVYARTSQVETSKKIDWLKTAQIQPLSVKIAQSISVIKKALEIGTPALLYSGGKDSEVLLNLLLPLIPNILIMYNNTNLADQKLINFIRARTKNLNYIETQAEQPETMWARTGYYPILSKRGFTAYKYKYPSLAISPVQCCYQLKEKPANRVLKENKIQVVFWGIRAGESNRRKLSFADNGFLFKPKKYPWYQAYPLQHWTDDDVLKFIKHKVKNYPLSNDFESGCECCGTDITFKRNNLTTLFIKNINKWKHYMYSGFAKNILIAKGYNFDAEKIKDIIENKPTCLLRI